MSRIHLPESIYESLPWIYLALAAALAAAMSTAVKWPLIALLVLAAIAVRRRRRTYRDAIQWRQAAAFIDKLERARKGAKDRSKPSTVEI